MIGSRSWAAYPATYRAREMKILADWITAGESGSVVGLTGCGRSNLLGILCHRPEIIQSYLPAPSKSAALIPVDLNNLPASNLSTLYRVILRAFYRVCDQFDQSLQQKITSFYQQHQAEQDPFLPQSALQELLLQFQTQQTQVVLVLNRFEQFCQVATPHMVNTLRGLRDDFKDTLCYIAGMHQEVSYLREPTILGEMYELLDNYTCWVGAMTDDDARNLVARATHTAPSAPAGAELATMLALSGRFPSLLRATCQWWLTTKDRPTRSEWKETLLAERSIQHRLEQIWAGLTQEEKFILSELQKLQTTALNEPAEDSEIHNSRPKSYDETGQDFVKHHHDILSRLATKGVCQQVGTIWHIRADLLSTYVATVEGRGRGKIWLDEPTGEIYQGQTLVKILTSLERSVLSFLIKHPYVRHAKTDLIINTWPDELRQQGVTDNSLYQVIFNIRREIEPNPSGPSYLITWRGKPEGGYQFFPEGRPA